MEIAPIPNLVSMRIAAPSAAPTEVPTTRAIDFRRQQDQEDAYTPAGSDEENSQTDDGDQLAYKMLLATAETSSAGPDDSAEQPSISVFA
jgi:hypothetical protein